MMQATPRVKRMLKEEMRLLYLIIVE